MEAVWGVVTLVAQVVWYSLHGRGGKAPIKHVVQLAVSVADVEMQLVAWERMLCTVAGAWPGWI